MEDLLEHISADNEISVVEIGKEGSKAKTAFPVEKTDLNHILLKP